MAAWERQYDDEIQDFSIFRIRRHTAVSPRTGVAGRYVTLEAPDWVNLIAITPDEQMVMVWQYRHGVNRYTLEVPAGVVEPGEEPLAAMQRELAEETGYVSDHWSKLGTVHPNPAFQGNMCHHFLALNCRKTGDQHLDAGEDIEVRLVPLADVARLIADGTLDHALEMAAFFRYVASGQPGGRLV